MWKQRVEARPETGLTDSKIKVAVVTRNSIKTIQRKKRLFINLGICLILILTVCIFVTITNDYTDETCFRFFNRWASFDQNWLLIKAIFQGKQLLTSFLIIFNSLMLSIVVLYVSILWLIHIRVKHEKYCFTWIRVPMSQKFSYREICLGSYQLR